MLELRELCCAFGGDDVLHGISLTFQPGEVLGLIGPNGSGKTTLLRAAIGLQKKTGGDILLDGKVLESLSPRQVARKVSYLPQFRNVPELSVKRFVMHGRFPHMGYPRRYTEEDRAAVHDALKKTGILEWQERPLRSLSGGQRQRVYLAMALAQESETLLMDEPTTYLDIRYQLQLTELARELAAGGKAVVLVLHDLPLAFRVADRLALLEEGRLLATGRPEELLSSPWITQSFGVGVRRADDADGRQYYYSTVTETEA